ncbi:MAG: hypothetical protein IJK62_03435, partial [Bacteroidales bacterium]|nr:hypothetical protein [Bacteroidales bacterium]
VRTPSSLHFSIMKSISASVSVGNLFNVTIFTQAENDKYMSQLDDILSTLDVKAIALGIGDMPDDDM